MDYFSLEAEAALLDAQRTSEETSDFRADVPREWRLRDEARKEFNMEDMT